MGQEREEGGNNWMSRIKQGMEGLGLGIFGRVEGIKGKVAPLLN
jgi:hypothetical protein